jgi:hypothetical protein
MDWHWLGSLAMILFWALIIVLALAPIKYLRSELNSPELRAPDSTPDPVDDKSASSERR